MHAGISHMVDEFERGRLSRRDLIARLTGIAAAMAAVPTVAAQDHAPPAPADPTFKGLDINHLALRVTDIDRSTAFYQKHLGLTVASRSRTSCFLRCGEKNFVALFRADTPGMDHYCYSINDYDVEAVQKTLAKEGLEPRRAGNRIYFDDPDGLEVQLAAKEHGV